MPMDLSLWQAVPLSAFQSMPTFKQSSTESEWQIESRDNAGGMGHILKTFFPWQKERTLQLKWQWSVNAFPVQNPASPSHAASDDYALRVGVLISGHGRQIPLSGNLKSRLKEAGAELSYIIFYVATAAGTDTASRCQKSPQSPHILLCPRGASTELSSLEVQPLEDLQQSNLIAAEEMPALKVVGLWIVTDSDDSTSTSQGRLSQMAWDEQSRSPLPSAPVQAPLRSLAGSAQAQELD